MYASKKLDIAISDGNSPDCHALRLLPCEHSGNVAGQPIGNDSKHKYL